MRTLTLRTAAMVAALTDAVQHHLEVLNDQMVEQVDLLMKAEGWEYEVALHNISVTKKEIAFLKAFIPATQQASAGISVFLEAFEVGVIKSALASLADIESSDANGSIFEVVSSENIKNTILSTVQSWGAIDPERLAIELARQAREALASKAPAQDLLDQLV